jgi:tetratricopeptide (TPR) repeat protein
MATPTRALAAATIVTAAMLSVGPAAACKDDFDHVIRDEDQQGRFDWKFAQAFNNRCAAYLNKGDFDRAIQDCNQAVRCWTRAIVGQLEAALADCNESLRLRPGSANTLDSRGFTHLKLGDLDVSVADYDAALQINPQLVTSLYGRGVAKRQRGDHAGGDADVAAAEAIKPNIAEEFARYGMR